MEIKLNVYKVSKTWGFYDNLSWNLFNNKLFPVYKSSLHIRDLSARFSMKILSFKNRICNFKNEKETGEKTNKYTASLSHLNVQYCYLQMCLNSISYSK